MVKRKKSGKIAKFFQPMNQTILQEIENTAYEAHIHQCWAEYDARYFSPDVRAFPEHIEDVVLADNELNDKLEYQHPHLSNKSVGYYVAQDSRYDDALDVLDNHIISTEGIMGNIRVSLVESIGKFLRKKVPRDLKKA
jgi:hypothetical protein